MQDALCKAFEMLVGEESRSILVEEPTYSGALSALQPMPCDLVSVPTDGEGIVPSRLRDQLASWDDSAGIARPRVLYTIPTGSNPTGATIPAERRREIYSIAREHDLLILEDDPYVSRPACFVDAARGH